MEVSRPALSWSIPFCCWMSLPRPASGSLYVRNLYAWVQVQAQGTGTGTTYMHMQADDGAAYSIGLILVLSAQLSYVLLRSAQLTWLHLAHMHCVCLLLFGFLRLLSSPSPFPRHELKIVRTAPFYDNGNAIVVRTHPTYPSSLGVHSILFCQRSPLFSFLFFFFFCTVGPAHTSPAAAQERTNRHPLVFQPISHHHRMLSSE